MDVTRIEAAPTKIIDWRRLTAKEIIKYNNEGVEVPPQYLSWAVDFRQSLEDNDKDETTYEMAETQKSQAPRNIDKLESQQADEVSSQPVGETPNADEPPQSENQEVSYKEVGAKDYKQHLDDNNIPVRVQGRMFGAISREMTQESNTKIGETSEIENSSNSEIDTIEATMEDILSKADELKLKIEDSKSKKLVAGTIAEIAQLSQQLEKLGIDAQMILAQSGNDFTQYEQQIDINSSVGVNAQDYGQETVDIGRTIQKMHGRTFMMLFNHIFGRTVENLGSASIDAGESLQNVAEETSNVNSANRDKISDLQEQIKNSTGVNSIEQNKDNGNELQNNNKEQDDDLSESDPANSNAVGQTTDLASASLEQIVLAKLRRGENV